MATIKGENLRILIGSQCVAAATSCTMQIVAETGDASTKDTEGSWAQIEVVGLSWNVTVDALVTDGRYDEGSDKAAIEAAGSGGTVFIGSKQWTVRPGMTIYAEVAEGETTYITTAEGVPIRSGSGIVTYTNETTANVIAVVGSSEQNDTVTAYMEDSARIPYTNIFNALKNKTKVLVTLSTTTGNFNAEEDAQIVSGYAYITDMETTAPNRQNSTYTVRLEGTDELTIAE